MIDYLNRLCKNFVIINFYFYFFSYALVDLSVEGNQFFDWLSRSSSAIHLFCSDQSSFSLLSFFFFNKICMGDDGSFTGLSDWSLRLSPALLSLLRVEQARRVSKRCFLETQSEREKWRGREKFADTKRYYH